MPGFICGLAFRVVMGQDEVAKLITPDKSSAVVLPAAISEALGFRLGVAVADA